MTTINHCLFCVFNWYKIQFWCYGHFDTIEKMFFFFSRIKIGSFNSIDIILYETQHHCLSLTDHLYTLFIISFFKQIIWNRLWNDTAIFVAKGYMWRSDFTKVRHNQRTPSYHLFYKTKWRRSGAHIIHLFNFVLSFSNAPPNWCYHNSKTLKNSVCVYWIVYLASCILAGVSLLSNIFFLIWSIEIGGV